MGTTEALSFRTSPAGIRFQRNQTIALIGGVVVGSAVYSMWPSAERMDPIIPVIMIATLLLFLFPAAPKTCSMEAVVESEHIRLRRDGMSRRIPVAALRQIKITRSAKGTHRHIRIWDDNNDAVLLLDPENGAALERWAGELAQSHGVSVTMTHSTLMGYAECFAFGAGVLMVNALGWITAIFTA